MTYRQQNLEKSRYQGPSCGFPGNDTV